MTQNWNDNWILEPISRVAGKETWRFVNAKDDSIVIIMKAPIEEYAWEKLKELMSGKVGK